MMNFFKNRLSQGGLSSVLVTFVTIWGGYLGCTAMHGQTNYQQLKSFGFVADATGAEPRRRLTEGSDGFLYGVATRGGRFGAGSLFRLNRADGAYQEIHSFNGLTTPNSPLVYATDGRLYGTVGRYPGALFRLNRDGTDFALIKVLQTQEGSEPAALIEGTDGALYGMAYHSCFCTVNTIFRLNKDGSGFGVLHTFSDGVRVSAGLPRSVLIEGRDGRLYGTYWQGSGDAGSVFRLNKDGTDYAVLHTFSGGSTEGGPSALLEDRDGFLYGALFAGGMNGRGAVFFLKTDGTEFRLLRSFGTSGAGRPVDLLQGADGDLYGITENTGSSGEVFKLDRNGTDYRVVNPVEAAGSGLIQGSDGILYGVARNGGPVGDGFAFSVSTSGTGRRVLTNFDRAGGDGRDVNGSLVAGTDGALYGTTRAGGLNGRGLVFKLERDGASYTILWEFTGGSDGRLPNGVIEGSDGALYGTTQTTAFKIDRDGTDFSILRVFGGASASEGSNIQAPLLETMDRLLYGTTSSGGTNNHGVLFRMLPDGSGFSVMRKFAGAPGDGSSPRGPLTEARDGALYGTTYSGGASNVGTVFTIQKDGGGFAILHQFTGGTGQGRAPKCTLLEGSDGMLYGTTQFGGGTLFRLGKDGQGFRVLRSFSGLDFPNDSLREGVDGAIYGESSTNAFRINKDGSGFAVLYNVASLGLTEGPDGWLYGASGTGGELNLGVVFKFLSPFLHVRRINLSGTGALLEIAGGAGRVYRVQAAGSMRRAAVWQWVGTNSISANGRSQFLDPDAARYPARFYRVQSP